VAGRLKIVFAGARDRDHPSEKRRELLLVN
jgi:hypothetical protein